MALSSSRRSKPKSRRGRTEATVTLCIANYSFVVVGQQISRRNLVAIRIPTAVGKRRKLMVAAGPK
jgi:hypothetical protein